MDLFDPRLTEQSNPRTAEIDLAAPLEIVDLINAEDQMVPEIVRREREPIARAIEIAVNCFRGGGRLVYVGAGTSGRLGVLDAAECPPTFGSDPTMVQGIIAGGYAALVRSQEGAEDRNEDGAAAIDEANVGPRDFVFGIATSSTTPYVRGALHRAAELGARTGFLCCTEPGAEVRGSVDVCIVPLVGPEVIAGSTRMKAGTATKLVLNTITTGAMIRLGKVYGNLMVDLQAWSQKLVDRSQRIVMAATGCTREEALGAIREADGSVKLAIVTLRAGASPDLARLYLAENDGFVRRALRQAEDAERATAPDDDPYAPYPAAPPDPAAVRLTIGLAASLADRLSVFAGAESDEAWARLPKTGGWSAKEHLAHLIDVDALMAERLDAISRREGAPIANRDDVQANRAIASGPARKTPAELLLQRLAEGRDLLLGKIQQSDPAALARTGRHERFGSISVYQILRHLVWHDHRHLEAIRRLITGSGP